MISNMDVYLTIAEEACSEMQRLVANSRTPKPDGGPGYIVTLDPDRRSFKQAMIAAAFAAMYFEALVYASARKRFGLDAARKIDRMLYEKRLGELGVTDPFLLDMAKAFREARKDLVHEKAVEPAELGATPIRYAQDVTNDAIKFVRKVSEQLMAAS